MKQPGEDQISHFLLSTVRNTTWTDRGDQNDGTNRHTTLTLKGVKPLVINILTSLLTQTTSCIFPGQQVITSFTLCYVHLIQITISTTNHTIQIPIAQKKDRCLPDDHCFPVSIPLCMDDYRIHTNHFHVPPLLPPTVVPIFCRSTFEHTQHLSYSSRPCWCYQQHL